LPIWLAGVRTPDIVTHIRCETRVAIQKKAIDKLRKYRSNKYAQSPEKLEQTLLLADLLDQNIG
jgi:hypothetical protein